MPPSLEGEIAAVPMFRRLTPADRSALAALARRVELSRGDVLFRERDAPDSLWVVESGRVKVVKSSANGRELILDLFGPGDPVGAVAVFEGLPYPATALAQVPATCLEIESQGFLALLDRNPSLVRGLLSGLALRLRELTARLADLAGAGVEARLARALSSLAEGAGEQRPEGLFVPVRLSRQELADLCGTTIETAIRVMSRWSKVGIVRTEPDGFLLLDRQALAELAQG